MDNPIPEEKLTPIRDALYRGELIAAIKLHRDATGSGLKEAKEAVEKLDAELRASSPDKFTSLPRRAGCFAMIVVLGVLSLGAIGLGLFATSRKARADTRSPTRPRS